MWSDLGLPWQVALEQAWEAYRAGTVPIGAVILDGESQVVARGRNRILDEEYLPGQINRNQLAHAELNALLQINRSSHQTHACTIYTTIEPCPLCMGAIYMSGVRNIQYAARDSYAGSTDLLGTTPYLSRKPIKVNGPQFGELEDFALGLVVVFELNIRPQRTEELHSTLLNSWRSVVPRAVTLGERLWENRILHAANHNDVPLSQVFDMVIHLHQELFSHE